MIKKISISLFCVLFVIALVSFIHPLPVKPLQKIGLKDYNN
jgi:hypothetical protein